MHSAGIEDATPQEQQLAMLLAEMTDAAQRGETVSLEAVCRQNPEIADELRQLWGAVQVAGAAGSNQSAATAAKGGGLALELPCRFGDYELLEEIGRGGMGVVFRARQLSLGREVAVKMILRGALAEHDERERFRSEAEAAARLDHPGIVPVYEVGEHDGRPYFNMKYVRGRTLAQLLADGPLEGRQAARILAEVARAIDFAHARGVLHRDLKPSNILIDEQGRAHVTDFGLAKQISAAATLTKTGSILGTPSYMSPEQAAGARVKVSPASDVYSLGSILYHMLAGRPPFQGASPVDIVLLVLEQDPAPPRMLNPQVDRDLELVALKCLQKPPELRYESAAALADDLEAYLADEPLSVKSGRISLALARMLRETHHAIVLENWGLLWMWHSLALFIACLLTNVLFWLDQRGWLTFTSWEHENRLYYIALWTAGFWTWAGVFWFLRRRMGPVTFVEWQIAHVWAGSTAAIALLFPVEWILGMEVLTLSPVLGLINAMVFMVKAGILSGAFYLQAVALLLTAIAMACFPEFAHLIFGAVSAACFFFPGLKYYRQRVRAARLD